MNDLDIMPIALGVLALCAIGFYLWVSKDTE